MDIETPLDDSSYYRYNRVLETKLLVDICLQSIGIGIAILFLAMENYRAAAIAFYLGVGAYQLISSLVHLFFGRPTALYKMYYIQLIVYVWLFLMVFLGGYLVAFFLLFSTPCTAIYYLVITIQSYNYERSKK